jgi:glutamine cyclotransferase
MPEEAQIAMFRLALKSRISFSVLVIFLLNAAPLFSSQSTESLKKSPQYEALAVRVVKTIPLPDGWHEGLTLDGTDVWVSNGKNGKVWVVDTISGKTSSNIEPIAGFTEAIFKKKDNLFFTTEWDEKRLYIAQLKNNKLIPEVWVSFPKAHPAGVLWNGKKLFVITWLRGMGTRFDLMELDGNLKYSDSVSIKGIQEPAHLAWDGKNLWITSWYDPLVYKIDIEKRQILGAFRSPISRTTGIVWDGKYFWLTGTHSDLYKLEIMG